MRSIIIFFCIMLFSCVADNSFKNDFYFNTQIGTKKDICNNNSNKITLTYKIAEDIVIYRCKSNNQTSFVISNVNLTSKIDELIFSNTWFSPWIITYDNKRIIAFKENIGDLDKKELVSIEINTGNVEILAELPYSTYWFSDHPISNNNVLVFTENINNVSVFDIKNEIFYKNVFQSRGNPIISKDGTNILFVNGKKVYQYSIQKKSSELLFDGEKYKNYDFISAYFGKSINDIYIKTLKYPNMKQISQVEFFKVKNNKIVNKGQMDFHYGYRYK